jgi:shikimate kinase
VNLRLKRTPGIYLAGFMACGKSTIGRMYADEIGWLFADLDADMEAHHRMTISELFARFGEEEFRRLESEALSRRVASIRRGIPTVLSLGGGAFAREENIEFLNQNGVTVWIDTAFSIIQHRIRLNDDRPLARHPQQLRDLYENRREFYVRAQYRIPLDSPDSRKGMQALINLCLLD